MAGAGISSKSFGSLLSTHDLPGPDLIIRTSGEQRVSNFMIWEGAYSELYFAPQLWPDFSDVHFDTALTEYAKRKRNYGK